MPITRKTYLLVLLLRRRLFAFYMKSWKGAVAGLRTIILNKISPEFHFSVGRLGRKGKKRLETESGISGIWLTRLTVYICRQGCCEKESSTKTKIISRRLFWKRVSEEFAFYRVEWEKWNWGWGGSEWVARRKRVRDEEIKWKRKQKKKKTNVKKTHNNEKVR